MAKKSKAEDRTVDMFSGKTRVEEIQVAQEDVQDGHKAFESIEQQAERLREKAFEFAEHLSKNWGQFIDGETFRLTTRGEHMYLEQFRHNGQKDAYGYAGVMFPTKSLYELTGLFVKASKDRQAAEKK